MLSLTDNIILRIISIFKLSDSGCSHKPKQCVLCQKLVPINNLKLTCRRLNNLIQPPITFLTERDKTTLKSSRYIANTFDKTPLYIPVPILQQIFPNPRHVKQFIINNHNVYQFSELNDNLFFTREMYRQLVNVGFIKRFANTPIIDNLDLSSRNFQIPKIDFMIGLIKSGHKITYNYYYRNFAFINENLRQFLLEFYRSFFNFHAIYHDLAYTHIQGIPFFDHISFTIDPETYKNIGCYMRINIQNVLSIAKQTVIDVLFEEFTTKIPLPKITICRKDELEKYGAYLELDKHRKQFEHKHKMF